MMDKRENNDFMTNFVLINYSPNRRIIDDQQPIDDFELHNCYFCNRVFLNSCYEKIKKWQKTKKF